jgi:RNA polymerase primary sigma factor
MIVDPEIQLHYRDISSHPLLTAAEEIEFARRARAGDVDARRHMIVSNLRLVVSIAKRFQGRGMALADLIGEGHLGLLRAVTLFDPEYGCRFSTYATWWIRQSIQKALTRNASMIRLPNYLAERVRKWRRAMPELEARLSRTPMLREVAGHLGISQNCARSIGHAVAVTRVESGSDSDGRGPTRMERTPDGGDEPEAAIELASDLNRLRSALSQLGDRERHVLMMRFGLDPHGPRTLKEIGQQLSLTRERVRQIQNEALAKLSSQFDELRSARAS